MSVQLARDTSLDQSEERQTTRPIESRSFERALRRDLSARRVISYQSVVGGARKRAFDLTVVGIISPLWLIVLAITFLVLVSRGAHALKSDQCVGYGGRALKRWRLNLTPRSADTASAALSDEPTADVDASWRLTWAELLRRLPEIGHVLSGEMSLVGPRPVSRQAFEALRGAKRHYASARPGWIGACDCASPDERPSLYRFYAKHWSMALDWRIIRQALNLSKTPGRQRQS